MEQDIFEIDAADKPLGRIASEIAVILRGKHMPSFEPRAPEGPKIRIKNINRARVSSKPITSYTGYPGGLRRRARKTLFARDPRAVLLKTVRGMLPNNKWRDRLLRRLLVS
jgi:large subunit ribosomal protein L13